MPPHRPLTVNTPHPSPTLIGCTIYAPQELVTMVTTGNPPLLPALPSFFFSFGWALSLISSCFLLSFIICLSKPHPAFLEPSPPASSFPPFDLWGVSLWHISGAVFPSVSLDSLVSLTEALSVFNAQQSLHACPVCASLCACSFIYLFFFQIVLVYQHAGRCTSMCVFPRARSSSSGLSSP